MRELWYLRGYVEIKDGCWLHKKNWPQLFEAVLYLARSYSVLIKKENIDARTPSVDYKIFHKYYPKVFKRSWFEKCVDRVNEISVYTYI